MNFVEFKVNLAQVKSEQEMVELIERVNGLVDAGGFVMTDEDWEEFPNVIHRRCDELMF